MDPTERYERLLAEPPSAKLVYKVLELEAPRTHGDIVEATVLPERTVSFALSRLQDADIVAATPCPRDPRKTNYEPRPVTETDAEPVASTVESPAASDGPESEADTTPPQPSD